MKRNKKFEDWYARYLNVELTYIQEMWDGSTYTSSVYHVEIAWAAWCAALGFEDE